MGDIENRVASCKAVGCYTLVERVLISLTRGFSPYLCYYDSRNTTLVQSRLSTCNFAEPRVGGLGHVVMQVRSIFVALGRVLIVILEWRYKYIPLCLVYKDDIPKDSKAVHRRFILLRTRDEAGTKPPFYNIVSDALPPRL